MKPEWSSDNGDGDHSLEVNEIMYNDFGESCP